MYKIKATQLLLTITVVFFALMAHAAWDRNIPRSELPDPGSSSTEAVAAGQINITGQQTIAAQGGCSFNTFTVQGDVTGTVDDGGGLDSVTCTVWDDGVEKDSQTLTVPVGSTTELIFSLSFEGQYATGIPGVGVYCTEIGVTEDPFIPEETSGICPSPAVPIPVAPDSGLLILITLIGLLGISALYLRKHKAQ